jgi:hypothetical protein
VLEIARILKQRAKARVQPATVPKKPVMNAN